MYSCPKGHQSVDSDFCSECGAKIQGGPPAPAPSGPLCPDCAAPRTDTSSNFCEICGYNFSTGAHGDVPPPAAAPPVVTPPPVEPAPPVEPTIDRLKPVTQEWTLTVAVDPSLRDPDGPEAPTNVAPLDIALDKPVSLIGRRSEKRAILPEVSLDFDDAVSHRHALLTRGDDGSLILRDIGSSNGTRLNGADVHPLIDTPLHEGDEITLGRWTRLTVKAS